MNTKNSQKNIGWYKHGRLPHFDSAGVYQMISYRLSDSLSKEYIVKLEEKLLTTSESEKEKERHIQIDRLLDEGLGSCVLRRPECARHIIDAWQFFHSKRYELIAWTVMPNHVHVLIQQKEGFPLGQIVSSWKKYSAKKIGEVLSNKEVQHVDAVESGPESKKHISFIDNTNVFSINSLWQKGYWDRFIRDENHYMNAIEYIVYNPVKANLVKHYQDWPFSGVNPE